MSRLTSRLSGVTYVLDPDTSPPTIPVRITPIAEDPRDRLKQPGDPMKPLAALAARSGYDEGVGQVEEGSTMPLIQEERALAAWFAAARRVAETSADDPLRSLAERVAEDYRRRYDRARREPPLAVPRLRRRPMT